jgi:hypothetical protein
MASCLRLQRGRFRLPATEAAAAAAAAASLAMPLHVSWPHSCLSVTVRNHATYAAGVDGRVSTGGRTQRPIFVAATRQHVGKTTVSLALMSGLQKRFNKVGFLKPVGQQVSVRLFDVHSRSIGADSPPNSCTLRTAR